MTRALGLKKTRNDAAGCGVWILGSAAVLFALAFYGSNLALGPAGRQR